MSSGNWHAAPPQTQHQAAAMHSRRDQPELAQEQGPHQAAVGLGVDLVAHAGNFARRCQARQRAAPRAGGEREPSGMRPEVDSLLNGAAAPAGQGRVAASLSNLYTWGTALHSVQLVNGGPRRGWSAA